MSFNQFTIIGNCGHSPKLSTTPNGKTVAKFSVAVNRKTNGKDETLWVNISAWDKLAEIVHSYVHTGDAVMVQGPLWVRTYEKDGVTRASVDLTARELKLLGNKRDATFPTTANANTPDQPDDDMPF